jgi:putative DNA methylase
MHNIAEQAHSAFPVTIYYAFKQSANDAEAGVSSTGWETFLEAVLSAGFSLTGTWPMRTERTKGLKGEVNALASSIILVCRKRPSDAPTTTRRDFINTLKRELKPALQKLQASNIAPVDLALQIINQELDLYFTEQDGELDRDSRFCVDLFTQYAFNDMKFGEADVLAWAKNTSIERLRGAGILYAEKGVVRLLTRDEISMALASRTKNRLDDGIIWLLTQQLTRALEQDGVVGAAKIVADVFTSEPEHAKALAYRLFQIAERKGWAAEAYAYNSLVIAWPDVQSKAAELQTAANNGEQMTMFKTEGN